MATGTREALLQTAEILRTRTGLVLIDSLLVFTTRTTLKIRSV